MKTPEIPESKHPVPHLHDSLLFKQAQSVQGGPKAMMARRKEANEEQRPDGKRREVAEPPKETARVDSLLTSGGSCGAVFQGPPEEAAANQAWSPTTAKIL